MSTLFITNVNEFEECVCFIIEIIHFESEPYILDYNISFLLHLILFIISILSSLSE